MTLRFKYFSTRSLAQVTISVKFSYNLKITKETIKEIGKLSLDLAKITFAIAILTPLIKTGNIDYKALFSAFGFAVSGVILINKGTQEDE